MKIGIAQLNSNDNIQDNFNQIKSIILNARSEKPKIIIFPENALFFRIEQKAVVQAVSLNDKYITELKDICSQSQINIHFTTAIEESGKVYNASVLIDTMWLTSRPPISLSSSKIGALSDYIASSYSTSLSV